MNKYINQNKQKLDYCPEFDLNDFHTMLLDLKTSMELEGFSDDEIMDTLSRISYDKHRTEYRKKMAKHIMDNYKCRVVDELEYEVQARNFAKRFDIEQPIIFKNGEDYYVPGNVAKVHRYALNGLSNSIKAGIKMWNAGREFKLKMMIGNERVENWKAFVQNKCR